MRGDSPDMTRPWMQFYSRDWLDNKELRQCSPTSRAILIDLMALAHEGHPYGVVASPSGPLSDTYLASRCMVHLLTLRASIKELLEHNRIHRNENGALYVKRMIEDERIRAARAAGGIKGGNPSMVTRKVNLPPNLTDEKKVNLASDSDSDSGFVSSSDTSSSKEKNNKEAKKIDDDDRRYPSELDELLVLFKEASGEALESKVAENILQVLESRMVSLRTFLDDIRPRIGRLKSKPGPGFFLMHAREIGGYKTQQIEGSVVGKRCCTFGKTASGYCCCELGKDLARADKAITREKETVQ